MRNQFRNLVLLWMTVPLVWAVSITGAIGQPDQAEDIVVTLLGTGSPAVSPERFSASTLIEAGGKKLLFDAGRGSMIRLWQAGVSAGKLDAIFLTHFHSDHTAGLPDLWLTGWLALPYGGRQAPLKVYGPMGVRELADNLTRAFADDIRIRIADEKLPPAGILFDAKEFSSEGVVYDEDGVRVTMFNVDHGENIHPSVGYRVDFRGKSVVLSGDTRFSKNLIAHAQHADVLIHEVAAANPALLDRPIVNAILHHHTSPEEAAIVFRKTAPRLAIYSHIVLIGDRANARPTPAEVVARTRETYKGEVRAAVDLDRITIGDTIELYAFDFATQSFR